jgi:O-antigen ligase
MLLLLIYALYRLLKAGRFRVRISATTLLAVFFWTAYCLRFIFDAAFLQIPLERGVPPSEMALFLFGICLPTFIVLYQFKDIKLYGKALPWLVPVLGACCMASLFRTATARDVELTGGGYQGNEALNHITYGHMGVMTMMLGLFVLLQIGRVKRPWYLRLLAAGAVGLGAFSMLASASRGAVVAGIMLIPVVVYLGFRCGSKILAIGICFVLALVLSASAKYLSRNGLDLDRQLAAATAYSTANSSVYNRENMLRDAWKEYLDHPWLGSSIVERNSLSYPHNAVVEAFMATGTFGGAAFALLVLLAIYRAITFMRRETALAWIPICFFQQLIGAMFSGGLYSNYGLWGMMAIMLGADLPRTQLRGLPE